MKKLILAIASVLAIAALLAGYSLVTAAPNTSDTGPADVIFTKWVTGAPPAPGVVANMAGVVSGDVGGGLFVGEVLEFTPGTTTTAITADYHVNGGTHQFTARVSVTMNNSDGTGALTGVITDGWLKGRKVRGSFQTISSSGIINAHTGGPFDDIAWQGTLRIASDEHAQGTD